MNDAAALQAKIHRTIPLSAAMGYEIVKLDEARIVVEAPLEPNINIHGTGFAGSLYTLGVLSAWALCNHVIDAAGLDAELVIAEANIRYRAPVRGRIRCSCSLKSNQIQDLVAGPGAGTDWGRGGYWRGTCRTDTGHAARKLQLISQSGRKYPGKNRISFLVQSLIGGNQDNVLGTKCNRRISR